MKGRTTAINLAVPICLAMLSSIVFSRMIFNLAENSGIIVALCIFSSVAYPICLRVTNAELGYWRELMILVAIIVIAFGISELSYYSKMEPTHHDFGEAFPILAFFFVVCEGIAMFFYTAVFLGSRALSRLHERS